MSFAQLARHTIATTLLIVRKAVMENASATLDGLLTKPEAIYKKLCGASRTAITLGNSRDIAISKIHLRTHAEPA
jgi:hypothetical protein